MFPSLCASVSSFSVGLVPLPSFWSFARVVVSSGFSLLGALSWSIQAKIGKCA